jgi:hypothetical protein
MHKDVRDYFNDTGMSFVYDFFRKTHTLMINGYNFLSQLLIANIDKLSKYTIK